MPISRNACLQRCLLLHEGEGGCGCCCCAGRVGCHHETRGSGTCFYEIILGTVRCKRLSLKCEKEDGELTIGVFLQCLNKVQSRGNSLLCASWGGGEQVRKGQWESHTSPATPLQRKLCPQLHTPVCHFEGLLCISRLYLALLGWHGSHAMWHRGTKYVFLVTYVDSHTLPHLGVCRGQPSIPRRLWTEGHAYRWESQSMPGARREGPWSCITGQTASCSISTS